MNKNEPILIACEESGIVTESFINLGFTNVFSCDVLETSGNYPNRHIIGDVTSFINGKCKFVTSDGVNHEIKTIFSLIIAFPPCTYLTVTGNRWFNVERYGDKAKQRHFNRQKAIEFFMLFTNADCDRIAIENPIGHMSTYWRKPDQIVHPYYFGDPERKSTCLWLKGLEPLKHDVKNYVEPNIVIYKNGKGTDSKWHIDTMGLPAKERAKERSKTFPGLAKAMANLWGGDIRDGKIDGINKWK